MQKKARKVPSMALIGVVDIARSDIKEYMLTPYLDSVRRAGGTPLVLPWDSTPGDIAAYCEQCDGLLFTGGADLDPSLYMERKLPECGDVTPERDRFEAALFSGFLITSKPVLAICRGIQAVNVFLGGSLWQDIPSQCPTGTDHRVFADGGIKRTVHTVTVAGDSLLCRATGAGCLAVNSAHHQNIKTAAPGLAVDAVSGDGFIESVHLKGHPFLLAVQWHPEHLSDVMPEHQAIFDLFLEAVKEKCGE